MYYAFSYLQKLQTIPNSKGLNQHLYPISLKQQMELFSFLSLGLKTRL